VLEGTAAAALLVGLRRRRKAKKVQTSRAADGKASVARLREPEFEVDGSGRARLRYEPEGWSTWGWGAEFAPAGVAYEINYVVSGPVDGIPVLLVHGFGASSYHWRYQVPSLAEQGFRVYSVCLLGYGWSPRVKLRYSLEVWATQVNAFLKEVVGGPAVLVGNSIGGFASLLAASLDSKLCRGLVLLNAAGSFEARQPGNEEKKKMQMGDIVAEAAEEAEPGPVQWLFQQAARGVAGWAFYTTKLRIQSILESVYVNREQVDEDLVTSIRSPADHPDALDTFGEVIQAGRRTQVTVFEALDNLPVTLPVLLIWGMKDPWMRPERAAAIRSECAERGISCDYVEVENAGHCPQDDTPDAVNNALIEWLLRRKEMEDAPVATLASTA